MLYHVKKILVLLLVLACNQSYAKQLSVENFFKNRPVNDISLSPKGDYLAVTVDTNDENILYILDSQSLEFISQFKIRSSRSPGRAEVGEIWWASNDRFIVSTQINVGGFELPFLTGEYFSANVDGTRKIELSGRSRGFDIIDELRAEPKYVLIKEASANYAMLYKLNVFTGKRRKIGKAPTKYASLYTDNSGKLRVAIGYKDSTLTIRELYYRQSKKDDWRLLHSWDPKKEGGMHYKGFAPDNKNLYVYISENSQLKNGYYEYNVETGKKNVLKTVNSEFRFSTIYNIANKRKVPVGYHTEVGYPQTIFFDNTSVSAQMHNGLLAGFPDKDVVRYNSTWDGKQSLVYIYNDTDPGSYYILDNEKAKLRFLMKSMPWINPKDMAEVKPFQFKARDGLEIHGYLTLPPDKKPKNLPMVLNIHGGPYGPYDKWRFQRENQFLANRGYIVMQVNYRGSGGFGRAFRYDNYKKMGAEMQDDVTDATYWAIKQGLADKDRICIFGGSYGGYAALMGVVKEPDLYQCAIPYVGLYDLNLMADSDINQNESGHQFLKDAWGFDDEKFIYERSPINYLDKLKAALFIVHGEKDKRVHFKNYEVLTKKLDEMKYPYESLVKANEGHGFYKEENNYELYTKMEKFLKKHIGD